MKYEEAQFGVWLDSGVILEYNPLWCCENVDISICLHGYSVVHLCRKTINQM